MLKQTSAPKKCVLMNLGVLTVFIIGAFCGGGKAMLLQFSRSCCVPPVLDYATHSMDRCFNFRFRRHMEACGAIIRCCRIDKRLYREPCVCSDGDTDGQDVELYCQTTRMNDSSADL